MSYQNATRHLAIDPQLCPACGRCVVQRLCRGMAVLRFDREDPPIIDTARCLNCQECLDHCPYGAVVWA